MLTSSSGVADSRQPTQTYSFTAAAAAAAVVRKVLPVASNHIAVDSHQQQ